MERKFKLPKLKKFVRPFINEGTRSIGTGPLNFDVTVARAHGWSDKAIERVYKKMAAMINVEWSRAQRKYPERYRRMKANGDVLFVGAIGTPGHADYHGPLDLDPKDYEIVTGRLSDMDRRDKERRRTVEGAVTDRRATKRRTGDKLAAKLRETRKR
jgi:hypothetical protein